LRTYQRIRGAALRATVEDLTLHLPAHWPWRAQFAAALARLRALPSPRLA
jgi:hypothetical protein